MSLLLQPLLTALDADGTPISGAKLVFTLTGGTTPATVYTDQSKSVAHPSPVIADSAGRFPPIYLDEAVTYRMRLYQADGATPVSNGDVDPVNPAAVSFASLTSANVTSALGFTPADALTQINVGTMFTGGGNLTDDVSIDFADIGAKTILGNKTAASAGPAALSRAEARAVVLPDFTGNARKLLKVGATAADAAWDYPFAASCSFAGAATNTTCTINAQVNVSSVTRTASGTYSVSFTSALPDANYHVGLMIRDTASNPTWQLLSKTSSGFSFAMQNGNAAVGSGPLNPAEVTFLCTPLT